MSDQTPPATSVEEFLDHLANVTQQHDFVLRAMMAEMERLRKLVPDPEAHEEGRPGVTRGRSTAYTLPEGWGALVITINDNGEALLDYKGLGHRETATMRFVRRG